MAFGIATFTHGGQQTGATQLATPSFVAVTGNLLVVAVSVFNFAVSTVPPVVTDSAGNTYTLIGSSPVSPSATDGVPNIWFYFSNGVTGSASLVISANIAIADNFRQIVAWQISGAASGSSAINTFEIGGGTTASNAQSTAALTTTVANSIVLAYGSLANLGATYSAGSGYTIDMANSDDGGLSGCEHQQFSSIQTGIIPTITATDSTHKWQMMAVAVAGAASTHSISGNAGVASATVSWTGTASGSTTADGSGNYTIPSLADGSYTITPTKTGYTFSPTNSAQTVSGANITGVNFTATLVPTGSGGFGSLGLGIGLGPMSKWEMF